jgi:tetratricopeptide (TPR) repeat protein
LWSEREVEQAFVANALKNEKAPKGWPAALLLFHLGMWRERMRNALTELAEGRTPAAPPPREQQDELNDAELATGIGTPLADAAARSDHLLAEIIALYEKLGERPFQWYRWENTTDAVLGNSYTHPRTHLYEYLRENGDVAGACRLFVDAVPELLAATENPDVHGTALYNLACAQLAQGLTEDAIKSLEEALRLRSELKVNALKDSEMAPLYDNERFQELVKS